jgi:hypothetical protein
MDERTTLTLAKIDLDGAIREAADALTSQTRAGFLRTLGLGGVALAGGGAALGLPGLARAATLPAADIAILNFALGLEYLLSSFYGEAQQKGDLGTQTRRYAQVAGQQEAAHVRLLKQLLGTNAIAEPKFDFKDLTTVQEKFRATADSLEQTAVHAYLGQLGSLKSKDAFTLASRILPVEARHAAWIRDIRFQGGIYPDETPAPAPLDDGFDEATVKQRVQSIGFVVP